VGIKLSSLLYWRGFDGWDSILLVISAAEIVLESISSILSGKKKKNYHAEIDRRASLKVAYQIKERKGAHNKDEGG
jgi:hypothetical protein